MTNTSWASARGADHHRWRRRHRARFRSRHPVGRSSIACPRSTPARNTTTRCSSSASASTAWAPRRSTLCRKIFMSAAFVRANSPSVLQGRQAEIRQIRQGVRRARGTLIRFEPDPTIFKKIEFRPEMIERRLRHYSYLNTGLKLIYNGQTFQSRRASWTSCWRTCNRTTASPSIPAPLREQDAGVLFHA